MTKKWDDISLAARHRDVIRRLIKKEMRAARPGDRYGSIVDIDIPNHKCTVQYPDGGQPVPVAFGHTAQPCCAGQGVRVSGGADDRYVSEITSPPDWDVVTYQNAWVDFGAPFAPVSYQRDSLGYVHLRGRMGGGTIGAVAFTLPEDYRPTFQSTFAVDSNSAFGAIDITANGDVTANVGSNFWVSLDGITFATT